MSNGISAVTPRLYLAGTGMITSVGPSAPITAVAIAAGRSGYQLSRYINKRGKPIKMAEVPAAVFDALDYELEECDFYNAQYDHTIKMAIIALYEACHGQCFLESIPLILSMPEPESGPVVPHGLLMRNLAEQCSPAIAPALTRTIHSGRAAGIEAIDFAFQYLIKTNELILVGGSDSYASPQRLKIFDEAGRLLAPDVGDGFAPGEGASFLLLTPYPELAQVRNGCIIALHPPGIAEEPGHLHSDLPYRGDGLDQAFKKALAEQPEQSIHAIYSSMNGEHFWAKEYGVAYLRNQSKFVDTLRIEHPADCYGDLGCATAPALIALAAERLWKNKQQYKYLVYSSSDTAKRGALVIEKLTIETVNN